MPEFTEKNMLKVLVKTEGWDALLRAMERQVAEWMTSPVSGTNAFETLRDVHTKLGKIEGLKEFLNKVETNGF